MPLGIVGCVFCFTKWSCVGCGAGGGFGVQLRCWFCVDCGVVNHSSAVVVACWQRVVGSGRA